jgi:hypothetical protein
MKRAIGAVLLASACAGTAVFDQASAAETTRGAAFCYPSASDTATRYHLWGWSWKAGNGIYGGTWQYTYDVARWDDASNSYVVTQAAELGSSIAPQSSEAFLGDSDANRWCDAMAVVYPHPMFGQWG